MSLRSRAAGGYTARVEAALRQLAAGRPSVAISLAQLTAVSGVSYPTARAALCDLEWLGVLHPVRFQIGGRKPTVVRFKEGRQE